MTEEKRPLIRHPRRQSYRERRAPIARMLTGRSAATGRRIVRLFAVESGSAVWADRAVAWWARQHGVLRPVIYRHRSAWLVYPGAHGRRWTRIPVPSVEQWQARRYRKSI